MLFTQPGATSVTLQPHQVYRARHAKWRPKIWQKFAENSWNVIHNAWPLREWSDHDPTMIREWTRQSSTRRATKVTFRACHEHFVWKNTTFRAPAIFPNFTKYCACHEKWHLSCSKYCTCHEKWHLNFTKYCTCHEKWHLHFTKYCACHEKWHLNFTKYCTKSALSNFHQVLRLPQLHQVLRLPRRVTLQHHQLVHVPRTWHLNFTRVMHLPRNWRFLYYLTIPLTWRFQLLDDSFYLPLLLPNDSYYYLTWLFLDDCSYLTIPVILDDSYYYRRFLLLDGSYYFTILLLDDSYHLTIPTSWLYYCLTIPFTWLFYYLTIPITWPYYYSILVLLCSAMSIVYWKFLSLNFLRLYLFLFIEGSLEV